MAINDSDGETVLRGTWWYADEVHKTVEVVAFDCDFYFDRCPTDDGREQWQRFPLNDEGLLYYVSADGGDLLGMPPSLSVTEALRWADAQPWAPIRWEGSLH